MRQHMPYISKNIDTLKYKIRLYRIAMKNILIHTLSKIKELTGGQDYGWLPLSTRSLFLVREPLTKINIGLRDTH
jgi:hypothetical protein